MTSVIAEKVAPKNAPIERPEPTSKLSLVGRVAPMAAVGLLVVGVLVYYRQANTPATFGFYNDDAIYLTTAKALATGQGYRIISLPYQPAQTKYPPFYPFLLSLVWRLSPDFPANIGSMILVALLSSIAAMILAWAYLTRCKYTSPWMALIVVGLSAINLTTVYFTVGVFSEMTFAVVSTAGLMLAELYETKPRRWPLGILLGVAIGLTCLTRANGFSLAIAVSVYLALGRRWRQLLLALAVAVIFVGPWMAWSKANRTAHSEINAVYFTDYSRHYGNVIQNTAARSGVSKTQVLLRNIGQNLDHLMSEIPEELIDYDKMQSDEIAVYVSGQSRWLVYALVLIALAFGFRKYAKSKQRLLPIYLLVFVAGMLPLPPDESSHSRYLLPVLPFLMLLMLAGIKEAASVIWSRLIWSTMRERRGVARRLCGALAAVPVAIAIAGLVLSYGFSTYSSIAQSKSARIGKTARFTIESQGMEWIRTNTPPTAVIACIYHAMYYLYTGRKAVLCFPTEDAYPPAEQKQALERIMDESGATYLALDESDLDGETGDIDYDLVIDELTADGRLEQVFKSDDGQMNVYYYKNGHSDR